MSHFTVLVIGDNVEDQLQPFHQFGCTGTNDEYIQEKDITEEVRDDYLSSKTTKMKDKDGILYSPSDEIFYRDPTDDEKKRIDSHDTKGLMTWGKDWGDGQGFRYKVKHEIDGYEEVEILDQDLKTFQEYAHDYYGFDIIKFGDKPDVVGDDAKNMFGYIQLNEKDEVEKIIERDNPNYQWDWWVVGGRWSGHLKLKDGSTGNNGEKSFFDSSPHKAGYCDQAKKKDIDFEGMKKDGEKNAAQDFDRLKKLIGGIKPLEKTWSEVRKEMGDDFDREKAREIYHSQEPLQKIKEVSSSLDGGFDNDDKRFLTFLDYPEYTCGRDEYIRRGGLKKITTFAVLKDGEWYQKGDMGWWGCVSDEKGVDEWHDKFMKLIDETDDDELLTVVDCHI